MNINQGVNFPEKVLAAMRKHMEEIKKDPSPKNVKECEQATWAAMMPDMDEEYEFFRTLAAVVFASCEDDAERVEMIKKVASFLIFTGHNVMGKEAMGEPFAVLYTGRDDDPFAVTGNGLVVEADTPEEAREVAEMYKAMRGAKKQRPN